MAAILEQIIASGKASREFPLGDATLAARLVNTDCLQFNHPRLIVEFEQDTEPALDQIIGFCLIALNTQGGGVPITHLASGSAITYTHGAIR
jgi:hypothetical protein